MSCGRGTLRFLGCALVLLVLGHQAFAQLTLPSASLPQGVVSQSYFASISTLGSNGPTTWTVTAGSLPPGISLTPLQPTTLEFTGTPTAAGNYSFTIRAVDATGASGSQSYAILVTSLLTVTTTSLQQATVGKTYSQQLEATGGVPPYTWILGVYNPGFVKPQPALRFARGRTRPASAPGESLPPGLTLSSSGQIAGSPTTSGSYTFDVTVFDSSSSFPQYAPGKFTITVNPQSPLVITTASPLPSGAVGKPYSIPLRAQGGEIPYTWTLASGTIPPGLTLGAAGSLTGTPTQAGEYTFSLTLTDLSSNTATGTFTLVIASSFAITTQSLAPGAVGVAYSAQINVTPTTGPYTFGLAQGSALPGGLSLTASSPTPAGTLSGTPTTPNTSGFTFTIVATDSANHTASQIYTLVITPAPITITPTSPLRDGTLGTAYSQQLTATGGAGGYVFSIGSGALPGGITLSSAGLLSGTPTAAGGFSFTVSVADSKQTTVTQTYQLTIGTPPVSTPTVTGVGNTAPPAQQPTISVQLGQPYPTDLTGTITLTFAPATGNVDDPSIQFSTGGRSASFTVPAGQTEAVFPATLSLGTGTVAGTITLTLHFEADGQDVTPQPAPTQVITIAPQAPVITKVTVSSTSGGIEVDVTGFSNTREMVSATFTFQAASGTTLQGGTQTITVGPLFATWYGDPTSAQYGSQFTFAQPFTIGGSASGIASVSVTLTNIQGTSAAVNASVP